MNIKEILKKLKLAEGTISMVLGALVIIVIGVLVFNYFRGVGKKADRGIPEEVEITQEKETVAIQPTPLKSLPVTYKTKAGDHLWKIAEEFYGSGYNWVDIAKQNNIPNANLITLGQELTIPDVPVRQPGKELPKTAIAGETISGDNYTVIKGDNLWGIAVRAYGDGYKWPEIARANNLANPDLIHSGNVLELPR